MFTCLFVICISSLARCLLRSLAHFFVLGCSFCYCWILWVLHIFWVTFISCVFCKYFLPVCGLFSHSLNFVFHKADVITLFLNILFIYLFLERGEGRRGREEEREGEKHQCAFASRLPQPTGDPAHNPGMCPYWESSQQHLGWQASTQSTETHKPGEVITFNEVQLLDFFFHRLCFWRCI